MGLSVRQPAQASAEPHDVLILGAGPAGLTAGIYAGRGGLRTALVERMMPGGTVANTEKIDNYPGFPEGISGFELAQRLERQAQRFGVEFLTGQAESLRPGAAGHEVLLADGRSLTARAVIIATGATPQPLGVPGEDGLRGKGVSYCAVCDGAFFKGQPVAVVGGGDSAIQEAVYLAGIASRVTVVHRRDSLRAAAWLQNLARQNANIGFAWNKLVQSVEGADLVTGLRVRDKVTGTEETLPVSGVFIYVGLTPNSQAFREIVKTDAPGYIQTDENMMTSVPGVFACGDVRSKLLRQIATAVGDAATAAIAAQQYIEKSQARIASVTSNP